MKRVKEKRRWKKKKIKAKNGEEGIWEVEEKKEMEEKEERDGY